MPVSVTFTSTSTEETIALGERFGALLEEGDVAILTGDLGAGKTQFTKGVAKACGYNGPVTSPTFNIQNVYPGERLVLYHFDLYRLEDPDELGDAGLLDALGEGDGACLIEWGETFANEIGDERVDITISRQENETAPGEEPPRALRFVAYGSRAESLLAQLGK